MTFPPLASIRKAAMSAAFFISKGGIMSFYLVRFKADKVSKFKTQEEAINNIQAMLGEETGVGPNHCYFNVFKANEEFTNRLEERKTMPPSVKDLENMMKEDV